MNAQLINVANPRDNVIDDTSGVAARLVEAACFAREGKIEAAKAYVVRALALLRGDPSSIPEMCRRLTGARGKSCAAASRPGRSGD